VCGLDSFDLVQGRGEDFYGLKTICVWWTVVDTMMNIWVPLNAGNSRPAEQLLASKEIICPCTSPLRVHGLIIGASL